jgi:dermatan/chondrotin sulfate uronyl 2-O-sulfotransferase UST
MAKKNKFTCTKVQFKAMPRHLNKTDLNEVLSEITSVRKPWMYIRHIHFINFTEFKLATPTYINIIRDPFDQFVSAFHFRREWRPVLLSADQKNLTIDECIKSGHYECSDPTYTHVIIPYFCGQQEFCLKPSKAAVQQAKRNVEKYYSVVGYLEHLKEFLEVLSFLWPRYFQNAWAVYENLISSDKSEVIRHQTHKQTPSAESKSIMKSRLKYDYEFYQFVRQRFDCLYQIVSQS